MNGAAIWAMLSMHILVSIVCYALFKRHILHVPGTLVAVIFLIPIFGLASALYVNWTEHSSQKQTKQTDIEKITRSESIHNMTVMNNENLKGAVLPLEEAILINDVQTRRSMMLDILRSKPVQYLDLLKVARLNDDIEVTHYATTTIIEIQRDFEMALQHQSGSIGNQTVDVEQLDRYLETLGEFIKSGLLDGHFIGRQRLLYAHQLNRKIQLHPDDKPTYFKILDNEIEMADFNLAEITFETMINKWPEDENVWFEGIRIFVESKNGAKLAAILTRIETTPIKWTSKGKERMKFWLHEKPPELVAAIL